MKERNEQQKIRNTRIIFLVITLSFDFGTNRKDINFYRTAIDLRLLDVISKRSIKKTFYGNIPIAKEYIKTSELSGIKQNFYSDDLPKENDVIEWLNSTYKNIQNN
ncbi:MAG: hypothetical protein JW866_09285 [Ignavibacteriales bacterium]|nr:hypothetical protein [Ignavibacteriales bacterium]